MKGNRIRAKLRSQRGASIIFALFFFIVCAVIGSIVLTAATAAAGRAKDIKKRNQDYYAANSAADLLEHQLAKPDAKVTLTVTRERIDTYTSIVTKNGGGWTEGARILLQPPGDDEQEHQVSTPSVATGNSAKAPIVALLSQAVNAQITSDSKFSKKVMIDSTQDTLDAEAVFQLNQVGISGWTSDTALSAENFNATLTVWDQQDHAYLLTMECPAHVDTRENVKEESQSIDIALAADGTTGKRTEKKKVTKTITYTITWSVSSVTKGGVMS